MAWTGSWFESSHPCQMMKLKGTDIVPDGYIFVCRACGKTSWSHYGFDADGRNVCSYGWDESCMMNCALYKTDQVLIREGGSRVIHVEGDPVPFESA